MFVSINEMKIIKTKHGKITLKKNSKKRMIIEAFEWLVIIIATIIIYQLIK